MPEESCGMTEERFVNPPAIARFSFGGVGYVDLMIGVGIALIVLGVVFLFVIPWVGLAAGFIGLVLAFLWIVGVGRRAVTAGEATDRDR